MQADPLNFLKQKFNDDWCHHYSTADGVGISMLQQSRLYISEGWRLWWETEREQNRFNFVLLCFPWTTWPVVLIWQCH